MNARVTIVDDDPSVCLVLRAMLQDAGFEVSAASDGAAALRDQRKQPSDVLLCDLYMPGMDGIEAIRMLRSEFPDLKIIAMSGGGSFRQLDILGVARMLGASDALRKPVTESALIPCVRGLLGH